MRRYTLLSQLVLVCAMVMPMPVFAEESTQSITHYYCDFEDENEVQQWNLLVGAQAASIPNKWVVGSALNNSGQKALYVSCNGGKSVSYTGSECTILAVRTLTLAQTGEDYTLSFDYIAQGNENWNGTVDRLCVAWVPETNINGKSLVLRSREGDYLNFFSQYLLTVNLQDGHNTTDLYNSAIWRTCQTTISAKQTGKPYRLVFIWYNGTKSYQFSGDLSACVDNIVINSSNFCTAPTGLKTTVLSNDSVRLDWNGNADQYEVGCHSHQQQTWQIDTVHTNSYTFSSIPEGMFDFYVRAICHDGQQTFYSGKAMDSRFIYYEDNHCINYVTALSDSNCYINTESPEFVKGDYKYTNKLVDYGYGSAQSRHTFHYLKTETDPRTGGKLKTVPEDEPISMRLGNWSAGGESERVEFSFEVDSTMSVFSLKYAVVLEAPGHDNMQSPESSTLRDPRFMFKVSGVNDEDARAASADFNASWVTEGWNRAGEYTPVMWKDWTTVSINLAQYVGKTLTVQLTTFDCTYYGHYGYAYFTLGCTYNKVGIQSVDGETVDFVAPAGFTYKWYQQNETSAQSRKQNQHVKNNDAPTILSREQTYRVKNNDDHTYIVELTSLLDTTRTYTLSSCLIERYPVAEATYSIRQENEKNYILFNNTSHVRSLNIATGEVVEHSQYALDSVTWHFGDLAATTSQWHPEVEAPAEGGTYRIALTATLEQRDSTIYMDVEVPSITAALEDIDGTNGTFITTRIVQCGELFAIPVSESAAYQWLSLTGQCLAEGILKPHASLTAPDTNGWFFLRIRTSTRTLMERVLVQ